MSNTTVVAVLSRSKTPASFTRMPILAARPVASVVTTGIARPRAWGHVITMTEIARDRANTPPVPRASA